MPQFKDAPEEVEQAYMVGDLGWYKMPGSCWWPVRVYAISSKDPAKRNVEFFPIHNQSSGKEVCDIHGDIHIDIDSDVPTTKLKVVLTLLTALAARLHAVRVDTVRLSSKTHQIF